MLRKLGLAINILRKLTIVYSFSPYDNLRVSTERRCTTIVGCNSECDQLSGQCQLLLQYDLTGVPVNLEDLPASSY